MEPPSSGQVVSPLRRSSSLNPTIAPFRPSPYLAAGRTPASLSPNPVTTNRRPNLSSRSSTSVNDTTTVPNTQHIESNGNEQDDPIPQEYRCRTTATRPLSAPVASKSVTTSTTPADQTVKLSASQAIPVTVMATATPTNTAHLPPRPDVPIPPSPSTSISNLTQQSQHSGHYPQHQPRNYHQQQDPTAIAYRSPYTGTTFTRPELEILARGEQTNARGDPVYFKPSFIDPDPWPIFTKKRELEKMVMQGEEGGEEGDEGDVVHGGNGGMKGVKYQDARKEEGFQEEA